MTTNVLYVMSEYRDKYYRMNVDNGGDQVEVHKSWNSEYVEIRLTINGLIKADMTLRSKEMVEQLHFMLGQVLNK